MNTRIAQHGASANRGSLLPVHCAWRAHGRPVVEVLAEFDSQEELHAAEIAAIAKLNTGCPHGYNVSLGGDTAPSKNPEVAAKIAARATGRKHTDTAVWVASTAEMWKSDEYRKKVLDGVNAYWTDERRAAVSEKRKAVWAKRKADGWTMPESTKEKLRGRKRSDVTRQKMSDAAKGKPKAPRSDETRAKLSAAIARSWANPDIREKRSSAIRAAKAA